MALFLKRQIRPEEVRTPESLFEVLHPMHERVLQLTYGGVGLNNQRHLLVEAKVTPPDEWVPLELLGGCTVWNNGSHSVPSVRWRNGTAEYRGLLQKPTAGASFAPIARVPETLKQFRPPSSVVLPVTAAYAAASVDVDTSGTLLFSSPPTFPAGGFVSLWGMSHQCRPSPPLWPLGEEYTVLLRNERGEDFGQPYAVFVLGATRLDRELVQPDLVPVWDTVVQRIGREQARKLRLRRIEGLEGGVEYTVTLLCLYP